MEDKRSKKIIFVSHCLLNVNSKLKGYAEYSSTAPQLLDLFKKYDLGIEQMPCPELGMYEINRKPKTKDEYDYVEYRNVCKMYAKFIKKLIEKYKKENYKIIGIIGVARSPSCGAEQVKVGPNIDVSRIQSGKGIFMEELYNEIGEEIPMLDFDDKNIYESLDRIESIIKQGIEIV